MKALRSGLCLLMGLAALMCAAAPGNAQSVPDPRRWTCPFGDLGYTVTLAPDRSLAKVSVSVSDGMDPDLERTFTLETVGAAEEGFAYDNDEMRLFGLGRRATIRLIGGDLIPCLIAPRQPGENALYAVGASFGGNLRAGPGTDFPVVGALQYGDPVTITRRDESAGDGHAWFVLALTGGTAFQRGDLLCSRWVRIEGIAETCGSRGLKARSLGGDVRERPDTAAPVTATLSAGDSITLTRQIGGPLEDYDWFEIETASGQRGYQWGGIVCTRTTNLPGTHSPCPGAADVVR